jgi:hypothetical protein
LQKNKGTFLNNRKEQKGELSKYFLGMIIGGAISLVSSLATILVVNLFNGRG